MKIGQLIRGYRLIAGLTQSEASRRAGFDRTYICHIEAGRNTPTIRVLKQIMETLDTEVDIAVKGVDGRWKRIHVEL